jgi:chromosome segregation ATPase
VKQFINASKKITGELGIDAQGYVKAAIKLEKIEVETGKNYNEITRDFEDKANRIGQLKEEIKQLDEERDESRKALWKQQRESGLTKKDLTYASALRDALTPCGFSLKDAVKIPKLITHIQACKQDPKEVLTRLERIDNLSLTISDLEETKKEKKQQLQSLEDLIEEAELKHSQLWEDNRTLKDQNNNYQLTLKKKRSY